MFEDFQDAFEKGHLTEFWLAVENRLTQAREQAEAEGPAPDRAVRLRRRQGCDGAHTASTRTTGRSLQKPDHAPRREAIWSRTNPGAYHVNTIAGGFGTASFAGIDGLALEARP